MKNWLYRALRTFFQGAIAYLTVAVPALLSDNVTITRTVIVGIGVTALMSGIAALMNLKEPEQLTSMIELTSDEGDQGQEIEASDIPVSFTEELSSDNVDVSAPSEREGEG